MKFKLADNITAVSVGGVEYSVDKGVVEIPDHHREGVDAAYKIGWEVLKPDTKQK